MPADLLFELGCEEIPAKLLARALAELPAMVDARLAAARLPHGGVRALGTPRRLAVIVKALVERQPDLREEVVGPPASAAFAPDGSLTKAGQGFAAKNGVDPAGLQKREVAGKKGLYVVALREVAGQDARALLPSLLAELAAAIKWPKPMRWGWSETTFVRPVQWLVALLGGEVVPLSWAGQTAGRASRGHRFLANRAIDIASAGAYEHALRAAHVVVDPEARRIEIEGELARLAGELGLRVRPDAALLDEVANLGEWPVGVSGGFDPAYLEIPEEIIVTAMRTHQRYFALEDPTRSGPDAAAAKLAPRFATVMATIVKDKAVVAKGNEKVLASRLSDARFFFAEDRKKLSASRSLSEASGRTTTGFEAWNARLDGVVFLKELGERARTTGAKIRRLEAIVAALGGDDVAREAARYARPTSRRASSASFPSCRA